MKAILEFNLPEDGTDHSNAINGWRYRHAVSELDAWLRNEIKYKSRNELQEVRDKLWENLKDCGCDHAFEFD